MVVARSNAEAKYRAITSTTYDLIWLRQLLEQFRFGEFTQMALIYDNQVALHIFSNSVRTKPIEVDCHIL